VTRSIAPKRAFTHLLVAALLAGLVPLAATPRSVSAATVPSGFVSTRFASGFGGRLTQMTFAADGRLFVSEKQGSVRIVRNGTLLAQPFLTIATNTDSEHGLKSLVFDPAYSTNRFVYVYYTDPQTLLNKVSRFTTRADNPDLADPASERVLVDGIASGIYHSGGALAFGPDGKLYISTGDASYSANGQLLGNINGKILRINKDGTIPTDNPFVGQSGKRPEIWAYGLRNPYTFAFSSTGRLFINDVGNATWEEINEGARGANYGWPTCEGACNQPGFVDPIYAYRHDAGPGKSITGAVFYTGSMFPTAYRGDYFFGDYVGNYIKRYDIETGTVSDFATDALNPVDLEVGPDGALYYLSVEKREIHRIAYGSAPPPDPVPDTLVRNGGFESTATDWLAPWQRVVRAGAAATFTKSADASAGSNALRVDVTTAAQDWYVQIQQAGVALRGGAVHTLAFDARASSARAIRAAFQQSTSPFDKIAQQTVGLGTSWTHYTFDFTPTSDVANALFNFNFGATVGQVFLDNVSLTAKVSTGSPPVPSIATPTSGSRFRAGDVVSFSGSATDPEDGVLPASALTWEVVFHHDTHTHPFVEPFSGATSGTFTAADTGETSSNVWYRIHLVATDSAGNRSEVTRDVLPVTAAVTLATQPQGLSLTLDGAPVVAPMTFTGVVGFKREIAAPATQTLGGVSYRFVSWSDGGAATHILTTPASQQTITALYERVGGSSNLVTNGGFEQSGTSWLSPWSLAVRSPARASVQRDTRRPADGVADARVDVLTARDASSVQLGQGSISLVAGLEHTLTFYARASSSRTIGVIVSASATSTTSYVARSVSIGKRWARLTIRFTPTVSNAAAFVAFNVGSRTGSISFDGVSLTR
jgi:glucose/arabinose dehydrogenase